MVTTADRALFMLFSALLGPPLLAWAIIWGYQSLFDQDWLFGNIVPLLFSGVLCTGLPFIYVRLWRRWGILFAPALFALGIFGFQLLSSLEVIHDASLILMLVIGTGFTGLIAEIATILDADEALLKYFKQGGSWSAVRMEQTATWLAQRRWKEVIALSLGAAFQVSLTLLLLWPGQKVEADGLPSSLSLSSDAYFFIIDWIKVCSLIYPMAIVLRIAEFHPHHYLKRLWDATVERSGDPLSNTVGGVHDGARLLSSSVATQMKHYSKSKGKAFNELCLGGIEIPFKASTEGVLIAGRTGSGKSILFRMLLKSVVDAYAEGRLQPTLFVHDPEHELLPIINQSGIETQCVSALNKQLPFWRWDLDFPGSVERAVLADSLVAVVMGTASSQTGMAHNNTSFRSAVSATLRNLLDHLACESGKDGYGLPDLVEILRNSDVLQSLLQQTGDKQSFFDIKSNFSGDSLGLLITVGNTLTTVAEWMDRKHGEISIAAFRKKSAGALVLQPSDDLSRSVDFLFSLMTKTFAQMSLEVAESKGRSSKSQTFVLLDEVVRLRCADEIAAVILRGRKRSISTVIGFQDINAFKGAYGEDTALSIWQNCRYWAALNSTTATAEYISSIASKAVFQTVDTNMSVQSLESEPNSRGAGVTVRRDEGSVLMPGQLELLPTLGSSPRCGAVISTPQGLCSVALTKAYLARRIGKTWY